MIKSLGNIIKGDNNTKISLYTFIGVNSVVRIGLLLFPRTVKNDGEEVWN
jgi:hypothetical protein